MVKPIKRRVRREEEETRLPVKVRAEPFDDDLEEDDDDGTAEDQESIANTPIARSPMIRKLTPENRARCERVAVRGVDTLRFDEEWNGEQIKAFMRKRSVKAYLNYLRSSYAERAGLQERTQFFAQLRINQMVPSAIVTLSKALRGDYEDASGEVQRAPSPSQIDAAAQILTRANIRGDKYKGEDTMPLIDARTVNVAIGEEEQTAQTNVSNRKVRSFLTKVLGMVESKKSLKPKRRREEADNGEETE